MGFFSILRGEERAVNWIKVVHEHLERQKAYRLVRFHFHSDCQATSTVDSSIRMNSQLNRAYVFPEVARGELDVNRFM